MSGTTTIVGAAEPAPLISVVLPLFNERAVLRQLYDDVTRSLQACHVALELIFVNDGSNDGSDVILDQLADHDARVRVLHLSRNFGHQAAVQAGLTHARGAAVIVMDSDLQDDPRCLPELIRRWQEGHDVVYAVRTKRKEGLVKRALFYAFYRLLNSISNTPVPNDAGNFGLISRRVADQLVQLNEYDRFYPGLRQWVGFKQVGVPVERGTRHDAHPRVTLLGLFQLAKTALFSFSAAPLSMFYGLATLALALFVIVGGFSLYRAFATGLAVPDWTSTVMTGSLLAGLNALGIAVLGEYVVRIYDQVRERPSFIVARQRNGPGQPGRADAGDNTITDDSLLDDVVTLQDEFRETLAVIASPSETAH